MLAVKSPLGQRGLYQGSSHGIVTFTIRAKPLPETIIAFLQRNVSIIRRLQRDSVLNSNSNSNKNQGEENYEEDEARDGDAHRDELFQLPSVTVDEFWPALEKVFEQAGPDWKGKGLVDRIRAFGPNGVGPNILFGRDEGANHDQLS